MAHSKITVANITGPRDLALVFEGAAHLDVHVHAGRIGARSAVLELEPGAPVDDLAGWLLQHGLRATVAPGDHLADDLSARERELVRHLAAGLQLKEVAQRMGVQTHTAREYWLRVKRKWDVRTMGEAVRIWTERAHPREDTEEAEAAE